MADLVHRIRAFALKLVGTTAPKQVKGDSTGVQGATRGRLLSWLQIVAVGFGLGVIFYLATTRSVIEFDRISVVGLLGAMVVNALALLLMSKRFQSSLAAGGLPVSFACANRISLQSIYYLFLLPLGVGMEAARYLKVRGQFPNAKYTEIGLPILADRAIGLATSALFGVCALVWLLIPQWFGIAFGIALVTGLLVCQIMRWVLSSQWQHVIQTLGYSMAGYLLAIIAINWALSAVGVSVAPVLVVLGISAGIIGSILPFALAGAGAGDVATAGALASLGLDPLTAALVATMAYFGRLMGAIIGGCYELVGQARAVSSSH